MVKAVIPTLSLGLLVFLVAQLGVILGSGVLGKLEGDYWPASTELVVTGYKADDITDSTVFNGTFYILRPDKCKWRRFEWYLGERNGRNVPVVLDFGPPQVRDGGLQEFYGWRLSVPPADFNNTFADVYHDCGLPWLVRTKFFN